MNITRNIKSVTILIGLIFLAGCGSNVPESDFATGYQNSAEPYYEESVTYTDVLTQAETLPACLQRCEQHDFSDTGRVFENRQSCKATCHSKNAVNKKDASLCEPVLGLINEFDQPGNALNLKFQYPACYRLVAEEMGDLEGCKTVYTASEKMGLVSYTEEYDSFCVQNIAAKKKDASLCDKAENPFFKTKCLEGAKR